MDSYAGIGSRETPFVILATMERIAAKLSGEGWTLRSGHADGADQAFERGAGGNAQIFLPWRDFNSTVAVSGTTYCPPSDASYTMAEEFHPAWHKLGPGARSLMARNCHQVLGPDLDDPVSFVVCWTKGGKLVGGTSQAIRIARHHDIIVYNLALSDDARVVREWLSE